MGNSGSTTSSTPSSYRRGLAKSVYQSGADGGDIDEMEPMPATPAELAAAPTADEEEEAQRVFALWDQVEHQVDALSSTITPTQLDAVFVLLEQARAVLLHSSFLPARTSALGLLRFAFSKPKLVAVHAQMIDALLSSVGGSASDSSSDTISSSDSFKLRKGASSVRHKTRVRSLEALKLAFIEPRARQEHHTALYRDTLDRLLRLLAVTSSSSSKDSDAVPLAVLDVLTSAVFRSSLDVDELKNAHLLLSLAVKSTASQQQQQQPAVASLEVRVRAIELLDDVVRQGGSSGSSSRFFVDLVQHVCSEFALHKQVEVKKHLLDLLRDCLKQEQRRQVADNEHTARMLRVLFGVLDDTNSSSTSSHQTDLKLRCLESLDTVLRNAHSGQAFHETILARVFALLDRPGVSDTALLELQCECLDVLRAVLSLKHLHAYHAQCERRYVGLLQQQGGSKNGGMLRTRVFNNLLLLHKKRNLCLGFQPKTSESYGQLVQALCDVLAKERAEQKRSAVLVLIALQRVHADASSAALVARHACAFVGSLPAATSGTGTGKFTGTLKEEQLLLHALVPLCIELLCWVAQAAAAGTGTGGGGEADAALADLVLQRRLDVKELGEILQAVDKLERTAATTSPTAALAFVHALVGGLVQREQQQGGKTVVQCINQLLFANPQYFTPAVFAAVPGFSSLFARYIDVIVLKGEVKERLLDSAVVPSFVRQFIGFDHQLVLACDGGGYSTNEMIAVRRVVVGNAKALWALMGARERSNKQAAAAVRRLPLSAFKQVSKMLAPGV